MIFSIEYYGANVIENLPFKIERPEGSYRYIFFHFISQVTVELNDKKILVSPGTCILYSPNVQQKFYVENNRLCHDFVDFNLVDENFLEEIKFPLNTLFNPRESTLINYTINEIVNEKNNPEIGTNYLCDLKLAELFLTLTRKIHHHKLSSKEQYSKMLYSKFEEIRLKIYQKPDSLNVSSIAKQMGFFSLSRFNELYKTYFNTTPMKDLTEARIKRVEELLKDGCSTNEIISKLGFSSNEYFYRWFKKHFKMTKDEYCQNLLSKSQL